MTNPTTLVEAVLDAGADLRRRGEHLIVLRVSLLSAELREELRRQKAEILPLVPPESPVEPSASPSASPPRLMMWHFGDTKWQVRVTQEVGDLARIEIPELGLTVTTHRDNLGATTRQEEFRSAEEPIGCIDCGIDLGPGIVAGICFPCRKRRNPDAVPVR